MKIPTLAALTAALAVGACAAPPPPPPPPAPLTFVGVYEAVAGRCHIILAENGQRYAVYDGAIVGARPGVRVRVTGVPHSVQDCPGATVIRTEAVTVVSDIPPPRRRVMAPK